MTSIMTMQECGPYGALRGELLLVFFLPLHQQVWLESLVNL